jgi:hypothetical protein
MSAATFIDGVHARGAFVHAQQAAGLDATVLQADQVRALMVELSTLQFAVVDATAITLVVTAGSWTLLQKQSLIAAIADASVRRTMGFAKRDTQTCDFIEGMLTDSDWATARSPDLALDPKLMCVSKRMYQLGLVCPKETLLEKAASIVLAAHGGEHSSQDKQRACKQVKAFIKALDKRQRYPLSHQLVYPATPHELSSDKFQFAYGDGGPVNALVDVDVYGMYANMAYRRSHRSLRPSSDPLALAPAGGDNAMQAMVQQAMQPIFAFANAFMQQLPPNPQAATGGVRISYPGTNGLGAASQQSPNVQAMWQHSHVHVTPPTTPTRDMHHQCLAATPPNVAQPAAEAPPPAVGMQLALPPAEAPHDDGDVDDDLALMESAMRANTLVAAGAAKTKNAAKAAVAKATKGKATPRKSVAVAAKVVMKRPAGAARPGSLDFQPSDYEKSIGAFTSMAYDRAKRFGEREGLSKDRILTNAKTAYNKSKDMYTKHWAV